MFREWTRKIIFALVFLMGLMGLRVFVDLAHATPPSTALSNEQFERDVDAVAAVSQEQSINKLSGLLKKYRGTEQEPILLYRLSDLQQQYAAIIFRVAHGGASTKGKVLDKGRIVRAHRAAIDTSTILIKKFPSFEDLAHVFYMRAKSYEEIEDKQSATSDYLHLVAKYPTAPEVPSAYMALAQFSIDANDQKRALEHLAHIEKLPQDPHYPFALFKMAWAYYNLKNSSEATRYIDRNIVVLKKICETDQGFQGVLENSLLDAVLFYSQGYELSAPGYPLADALSYFRRLESGPILGKMGIRFTKILRSQGAEKDLIRWKDQWFSEELKRSETGNVLMLVYEYLLERSRYSQLVELSRDMVRMYSKSEERMKWDSYPQAQRLLLDTTDGLQKIVLKNKEAAGSDEVKKLSMILAAIYDSFTRVVTDADPRVPGVHYNLAETLFAIGDFAGATEHYRWVIEKKMARNEWDADVSLKAIAARYEVLHQKGITAREIKAQSLAADRGHASEPLLLEWVKWIDLHFEKKAQKRDLKKDADRDENFAFEANRALYAGGSIAEATTRMQKFATSRPHSSFAIPSLSLVIDTLIASAEWKRLNQLTEDSMALKIWTGTPFGDRLFAVAADSFYKQIEQKFSAKSYRLVLGDVEDFGKKYHKSQRIVDAWSLAGKSALILSEKAVAGEYFTRIVALDSTRKADALSAEAYLGRAQIGEEKYDFTRAAADYLAYVNLSEAGVGAPADDYLRKKVLAIAWVSGDLAVLNSALNASAVCGGTSAPLKIECDRYQALARLVSPQKAGSEEVTQDALDKVKEKNGENRTVWAALALEGVNYLEYRDRLYLLRQVSSGWDDADPLIKLTLASYLSLSIPKAMAAVRKDIPTVAPLRANEKYIVRRVEVVREIENAATKVLKLPWARIRSEVLSEMAGVYLDLSKALEKLPAPKDLAAEDIRVYEETIRKLILPFEEKGQDLRSKAFEIASKFSIEDGAFDRITEAFFSENPSQAKRWKAAAVTDLGGGKQVSRFGDLSPTLLGILEQTRTPLSGSALRLREQWASAVRSGKWAQVAFFIQEAQEKKMSSQAGLFLIRAVSLASLGARAEGLLDLDAAYKELSGHAKLQVGCTLLNYSSRTLAHEKTRELLDSMAPLLAAESKNTEEGSFVAWVGARLPVSVRR